MLGDFMKKILDATLLKQYSKRHNITGIFDDEIVNYAQLHFYEKEEYILKSEDALTYYYLLVDGKIRIFYPFENGKSMFLKFYKDFITIGDLELLKNIPVLCNINAVEDTYLIAIPAKILREKYFDNVKFLHHLVDSLSEKLCGTINNSSYNFVYPLINRLASYLVPQVTETNYIMLNSSYLEIAQFLGTTYRHLNRTFKEMEAKLIIKYDDKKIYVLDIKQLTELSKNIYTKPL